MWLPHLGHVGDADQGYDPSSGPLILLSYFLPYPLRDPDKHKKEAQKPVSKEGSGVDFKFGAKPGKGLRCVICGGIAALRPFMFSRAQTLHQAWP